MNKLKNNVYFVLVFRYRVALKYYIYRKDVIPWLYVSSNEKS